MSHRPGQPPPYMRPALRHLRKTGGAMSALIRRYGPPKLKKTHNTFETLGRSIIGQQLAGAAVKTIYGRFLEVYPARRFPTPKKLLATPDEALRSAGLSRAKVAALKDLARYFAERRVIPRRFRDAPEDEIAEALLPIRGVGPWSIDMFLIFGLNRPDVLPVGDLGVRKGMQIYFSKRALPDAGTMRRLAQPWRPFRSIASWYMWRVAEDGLP